MKTSGITAALPAQDLGRARAFYVEKVGLQALRSAYLKARDGQVGLTVGDGVSQLFVYPAQARSSGEFTQAVIHVADVRAAVEAAGAAMDELTEGVSGIRRSSNCGKTLGAVHPRKHRRQDKPHDGRD
jgi:predicted enzyme related to lactoylglutathione lyase